MAFLAYSLGYSFTYSPLGALPRLVFSYSAAVRWSILVILVVRSTVAFILAFCESSQLPRKKTSSESFTRASSGPKRCSIARWRALVSIAPVARVNRLLARSKRTGTASRHVFCELSTLTGRPPVAQAAPAYASWEVDLVLAVDVVPRKTH